MYIKPEEIKMKNVVKKLDIINGKTGLVCAYCGATKSEVSFVIGASSTPDWCMVYGTGKMACLKCYPAVAKEGSDRVDAHVAEYNASCVVYTYEHDLEEYVAAIHAGKLCQIDEEMFYYFLEV